MLGQDLAGLGRKDGSTGEDLEVWRKNLDTGVSDAATGIYRQPQPIVRGNTCTVRLK